ncbi:MAG: hypothetical protein N3A63_10025 [Bacteroidetes bacterium]|nr:hypothetical protein [Bacteroidota bacterium]
MVTIQEGKVRAMYNYFRVESIRVRWWMLFILIVFTVGFFEALKAQSQSDWCDSAHTSIWFDVGFYPFRYSNAGDFEPRYVVRAGWSSFTNGYFFLEYTNYAFNSHSGTVYRERSKNRYDVALYGAFVPLEIFILGVGVYYAYHDDIVTQWLVGSPTPYEAHSGTRTHIGFYYLLGFSYRFKISTAVAFPIGFTWRNQWRRTNDFNFPHNTSLRFGIEYTIHQ